MFSSLHCSDFKNFVLPLQAEEPKIHIFNTKCTPLVKDILSKFIDQEIYLKGSCARLLVKKKLLDVVKDKTKYKVTPKFYSFFMYPGSCNHCSRSDASSWQGAIYCKQDFSVLGTPILNEIYFSSNTIDYLLSTLVGKGIFLL